MTERALRNNPDIQAAQESLVAAQEMAVAQRGAFVPGIRTSNSCSRKPMHNVTNGKPRD